MTTKHTRKTYIKGTVGINLTRKLLWRLSSSF